ncbi:MAG: bacteriocin fulvocin C-related protein [Bacteroidales bacterium]|nr:bacteriocin fulvocin C-related protein [Bacteroidales bacterium]
MKNRLHYIAITFLALLTTSCIKESGKEVYTCNEELNSWIHQYKSSLDSISREQLVTLPVSYQIPIYLALSSERKAEIWNSKIEKILSEPHSYSTQSVADINLLKSQIDEDFFDSQIYDSTMVQDFIDGIFNYSPTIDTLSVVIDFASLFTYDEAILFINQQDSIDFSWLPGDLPINAPGGPKPNCICRWNITCGFLNHGHCNKNSSDCKKTDDGCGWFLQEDCTGRCSEDPFNIN